MLGEHRGDDHRLRRKLRFTCLGLRRRVGGLWIKDTDR